jgi:hypothetical protein
VPRIAPPMSLTLAGVEEGATILELSLRGGV